MNIQYFAGVNSIEELKQMYRKLAKKYHPDLNENDTTKIMSDINNEYDYLFSRLKSSKGKSNNDRNSQSDNSNTNDSNDYYENIFKDIISKLVVYEGLNIDIVGTWIWLSGETYSIKDVIKELGFKWSKSNKKWYLGELSGKRRKATTWEQKVNKYGCQSVKSEGMKKLG